MNPPNRNQSLAARVASLQNMRMPELWKLWDEYFPRRPAHNNRNYIEGRIAYKLQEQELGCIAPEVRKQLVAIGESQSRIQSRPATVVRLVPGTLLVREYDDREHRVTAMGDGTFEYEGKNFKSLSAVARRITGCPWSGPVFFGLKQTQRKTK